MKKKKIFLSNNTSIAKITKALTAKCLSNISQQSIQQTQPKHFSLLVVFTEKKQRITKQNENQWKQLPSAQNSMTVNPITCGHISVETKMIGITE